MFIKNSELPLIASALTELYGARLPFAAAKAVAKNADILSEALDSLYESEKKLNDEFLLHGEDGNLIVRYGTHVFDPSRAEEFEERVRELRESGSDLPLKWIDASLLGSAFVTPLSAKRLAPILKGGR